MTSRLSCACRVGVSPELKSVEFHGCQGDFPLLEIAGNLTLQGVHANLARVAGIFNFLVDFLYPNASEAVVTDQRRLFAFGMFSRRERVPMIMADCVYTKCMGNAHKYRLQSRSDYFSLILVCIGI
jgi:hypothetical protein